MYIIQINCICGCLNSYDMELGELKDVYCWRCDLDYTIGLGEKKDKDRGGE